MQIFCDHDVDLNAFESRSSSLLSEILQGLTPDTADHLISRDAVYTFKSPETEKPCVYLIKDGCLTLTKGEKTLLIHEQGELVGLEQFSNTDESQLSYSSEFACKVDVYEIDSILEHVSKNSQRGWTEFLVLQLSLFQRLFSSSLLSTAAQDPNIQCFERGETIIEEGTKGAELYNLVTGSADVFVKGVKVGEVNAGEMFGAIAALTDSVRTATVIASDSCMVSSMESENFVELVRANPKTVCKLVEDMAGRIVALNNKILQ